MVRHKFETLVLIVLTIILLLATRNIVASNGDFSLQLNVNGRDVSKLETIVIDPDRELVIDLHIFNVAREITLERVLVEVTFIGQTILSLSENLGDRNIIAGEDYHPEPIVVTPTEMQGRAGVPIVMGIYRVVVNLEYTVGNQQKFWSGSNNIKITGNPLSTPLGGVGIITSGGAITTSLFLVRALISPGIPAGTLIPARAAITPLAQLHNLVSMRLESTARGRVVGNITAAAKGRIIKKRCPICGKSLKYGYCYTCKKSAKELRNEYQDKIKDLALQSSELLTSGQVVTLDDLYSRLGISAMLGTDVIATLKHAKLVRIKGITRKLMGKAVMFGIGSGLSAVIWITVGGFAVLSTSVLIAILVVSVVIPVALTKSLQMKARRDLNKR